MSVRDIVMAAAGVSTGPIQGQYLLGGPTASTELWTVPAGVTSVSIVCVQEGQGRGNAGTHSACDVLAGDYVTVLVRAQNSNRVGDGGGNGGAGGAVAGGATTAPGSGGAGGYAGNGGNGGSGGSSGTAGAGGGGGGGGSPNLSGLIWGGGGGGVGVLGQGTNGAAGTSIAPSGGGGSGGANGDTNGGNVLYGSGQPGVTWGANSIYDKGGDGGALSYKNAISVTPGGTLLLRPYGIGGTTGAANAAIRIIWGPGRSFPSTNTGNV